MSLFEPIFHDERTLEKLQDALHKVILERDALKRENDRLTAQLNAAELTICDMEEELEKQDHQWK